MLSTARTFRAATTPPDPSASSAVYLRRFRGERPRPKRHRALLLALAAVAALLFARVWQVTVAHGLAMERDRLRHSVHALENRIRISSDLTVQTAMREGLDYGTLARQGFRSPEPSALIDIDLGAPLPRVTPRDPAAVRLASGVGRLLGGLFPWARDATAAEMRTVSARADRTR